MAGARRTEVFDRIAEARLRQDDPWREEAACRTLPKSAFFDKRRPQRALAACRRCTVLDACYREWLSLTEPERGHGVWWGTTERMRRTRSVPVSLRSS